MRRIGWEAIKVDFQRNVWVDLDASVFELEFKDMFIRIERMSSGEYAAYLADLPADLKNTPEPAPDQGRWIIAKVKD
jgi:hypothetical protein